MGSGRSGGEKKLKSKKGVWSKYSGGGLGLDQDPGEHRVYRIRSVQESGHRWGFGGFIPP